MDNVVHLHASAEDETDLREHAKEALSAAIGTVEKDSPLGAIAVIALSEGGKYSLQAAWGDEIGYDELLANIIEIAAKTQIKRLMEKQDQDDAG